MKGTHQGDQNLPGGLIIISGMVAFESDHFVETSHMSIFPAELGGQKRVDQLLGDSWTNHSTPDCENIQIIVFDRLVCRIRVMSDG